MQTSLERIVTELDVLIRARYPLIAINTSEEQRFHRVMQAVAQLKCHREKEKGLYVWSRTTGLRQVLGAEVKAGKELLVPETQDAVSVLDYIAQQKKGLFVLCDYSPYLAPFGQPDALLVRRLRELAWDIKGRHCNVLMVERHFPDLPALEKEIKTLDLPLPNEQEVAAMLMRQIQNLRAGEVAVNLEERAQEQLVQALLGLTETDIENVLAKAIICGTGLSANALPVILEEKQSVIKGTGALTYTHAVPTAHLGGYPNLRRILTEAAATFTPAAKAYGVEPMKGLLMVGLPGCGKDLTKKIASSVMGKSLLDLDFGSVMGEGGGVIGSSAMTIKRALAIATTLRGILGISEFEKAVGGLESSARSDGGETARTIAYLLNWMQEQFEVFVIGTANDVRGLAAEQTRQGRFSHIVFVDLPTLDDRREIFRVHLHKRERAPDQFDLDELAEVTDGFSGAEIEAAVKAGLLRAFMDGERSVTTADIVERARQIQPISHIKREQVEALRNWAKDHLAINANSLNEAALPPLNEPVQWPRALEM
ncbi:MAG TPA: AAA family ATPase [Blastocatellia bacterium]|nr:AAA family ATPase [Blastocatellia bacterium]HMZ19586.1 AAA family ATPase [Blastocatellia bacterium]